MVPHSLFLFRYSSLKFLFLFLSFFSFNAHAQNYHCRKFKVDTLIFLDDFPVEKGSINVDPPLLYRLSRNRTHLVFDSVVIAEYDSVSICYRTISAIFKDGYYVRDIREYNGGVGSANSKVPYVQQTNHLNAGKVNTYGAISRGISVGNQQNLFVNSALNLQMDGQLSDNLWVNAVITDQNIPYQPEGNTQQIQDFDNVFVKMYNDDFSLTTGDIVLKNRVNDEYFLKYYKNVQGLQVQYLSKLGEKWHHESQLSGALSKGQFASVVIDPIEGVQGPYKLRGANGERFVVIMANSEKIFVDGKELQRGFDRDYVIDYNLGEITFSSTVLITRFSRIRVDYEYANQFYSRSNISVSERINNDQTSLYFNFYREKDNRSNALAFDINPADESIMRELGDHDGVAFISGVDSSYYVDDAVLYEKIDTVINSLLYTIYRYSQNEKLAKYHVSFTDIGEGQGSYQLISNTTNGKIFEWVGKENGAYEPVRLVPLPNQKQMVVTGFKHNMSAFESVYSEWALSDFDQNLYSSYDDGDNLGGAWKGGLMSEGRSLKLKNIYKLSANFSYEFNHQNFRYIDRFRQVDFDRDWNYDVFADSVRDRKENIVQSTIGFKADKDRFFEYHLSHRNRSGAVNGWQQSLDWNQKIGRLDLSSKNYLSSNQLAGRNAQWLRSRQQVVLHFDNITPGYVFSVDQQQSSSFSDSVVSTLMHFKSHNWFLQSGDSLKSVFRFDYLRRYDQLPVAGVFVPYTFAEEFKLSFYNFQWSHHQVNANFNWREVKDYLSNNAVENQLLGNLSWVGDFAQEHIKSNFSMSTANVRELKRTFIYISVPVGQGTHTWRDENEDGLQDLNEFYEARNADEKNYIKLFTPTDEYINGFQTIYTHTLDMRMPDSWSQSSGLRKQFSRLSAMTNMRYHYKTTNHSFVARVNPFFSDIEDELLLSARNQQRVSLYYNRNAPGVSFELNKTGQQVKSLLGGGFEIRNREEWQLVYKLGFGQKITIRGHASSGTSINISDFMINRNFEIAETSLQSEIMWQPNNSVRFVAGSGLRNKENHHENDPSMAFVKEYSTSITWINLGKGNLNTSLSWVDIAYDGQSNTYAAYEMLEALQPGANQRWTTNWQYTFNKTMQLTLQYFGRKSAGQSANHTGSMMVTAFF